MKRVGHRSRIPLRQSAWIASLFVLLSSPSVVNTFSAPFPSQQHLHSWNRIKWSLRERDSDASSEGLLDVPEEEAPKLPKTNQTGVLKETLRRLAQLSLEDYEWRSGVFKANEADRMIEESIARMRGEDPAYVRPMDAQTMGPLGRWETNAVSWLSRVIDEEGRRAKKIVNADGELIRPIDNEGELGPLGYLEKLVVDFIQSIRKSEKERARTNTLRPKDLDESLRGPLGEMEMEAVKILEEIQTSEKLRAEQSRSRGGEVVRPIDVPGPLGEFEMAVTELFQAEKLRSAERKAANGEIVRPKDAKVRGPLGEAEYQAYEAIKQLNLEEMKRLESIRRLLKENRPMEKDRNSFLGFLESLLVGFTRGPKLLVSVIDRVKELLSSEVLPESDRQAIQRSSSQSQRLSERQTPTSDDPDVQQ